MSNVQNNVCVAISRLNLATVGGFMPWKLANTTNENSFPPELLLNTYQQLLLLFFLESRNASIPLLSLEALAAKTPKNQWLWLFMGLSGLRSLQIHCPSWRQALPQTSPFLQGF